ncbi:VanZ family protein [Paenibacillus glycanilyticus]|uniref:VanZ family protein n=1 Tax=Paenibacillus glycanilyticus TaxID=126569 RepID=UPI0037C9BC4E
MVPFGILLPLIALKSIKASKVIYLSLGWSLCLEIIELVFSRGTFDVDDLILNAFGAFLGFLGFRFIAIIVKLVYKKAPKQPSRSMKDKYLQAHK